MTKQTSYQMARQFTESFDEEVETISLWTQEFKRIDRRKVEVHENEHNEDDLESTMRY